MKAADTAMYEAKDCGKNRVTVWQFGAGQPRAKASPAARFLRFADRELERNIRKTGASALELDDGHLNALIEYGEKHGWEDSKSEFMNALCDLLTRTAAQKRMPRGSASGSHESYKKSAAAVKQEIMDILSVER